MNKQILNVALAVVLSGSALSAHAAASYTFTRLGHGYATAINDAGQVVGESGVSAILWNGTTATDLGTLGGRFSQATAINDAGQVAGVSHINDADFHATLWNGTTATDLGTLGGTSSYANAINDAGQVVGQAADRATVWNGTTATALGTLGGTTSSVATDINDAGQVVGWSSIANGALRATVWNGTTPTELGTLGGAQSWARAINNAGQVVGWSGYRATLWNGTTATDLNSFLDASTVSAGWRLESANAINDNGWIVGTAYNSLLGMGSHAFLLTPVPEAETWAMMLAGLGLVGWTTLRRRPATLPII